MRHETTHGTTPTQLYAGHESGRATKNIFLTNPRNNVYHHDYLQDRTLRWWHTIHLLSARNFRVPLHSVANKQLTPWHIVVRKVRVVEHAGLDDHSSRERFAGAKERGATVRAEVRSDLLAGICGLRDLLWLAYSMFRDYIEI